MYINRFQKVLVSQVEAKNERSVQTQVSDSSCFTTRNKEWKKCTETGFKMFLFHNYTDAKNQRSVHKHVSERSFFTTT